MKIFKTIVLLLVLGLGGFFYMNPYMMKPVLAEVSNLKELIVSFIYTDDSKVNKNEAVVINTYIIDPNIENNFGLDIACFYGYKDIVSVLLADDRLCHQLGKKK